jgi:hypothetical protein
VAAAATTLDPALLRLRIERFSIQPIRVDESRKQHAE